MNIHYFQHVPFEGLGSVSGWSRRPGNRVTATRFYEDQKLPFVDICDMLIVMGGPMGVYDEEKFPWMAKEKEFISKALDKGKKVVGICLGAQLLASVLGAEVYKNQYKEIGWFPVEKTDAGRKHPLLKDFSENQTVFHWHGDTFDLPSGAENLLRTPACENQLFIYKNQAIGIQFHMEMREEDIKTIADKCGDELVSGPYIQTPEKIFTTEFIAHNNKLMEKLLSDFVKL
jgi:GMP synthase-like glutamine amidotransferase